MKYSVHENVELYSISYWVDWQIRENDHVIKAFIKKENADNFCRYLNEGHSEETADKKTYETTLNKYAKIGLSKQQSERQVKRDEPWAYGEYSDKHC